MPRQNHYPKLKSATSFTIVLKHHLFQCVFFNQQIKTSHAMSVNIRSVQWRFVVNINILSYGGVDCNSHRREI